MFQRTPRKTFRNYYIPLFFQTAMLFGFGMGFGSLITHLHHTQQISPMPIPENASPQYYQIAWGIMGVLLGNALPQLDAFFENDEAVSEGYDDKPKQHDHVRTLSSSSRAEKEPTLADNGLGPIWHSTVRSVGAFVGIAFALVSFHNRSVVIIAGLVDMITEEGSMAINSPGFLDAGCSRPYSVVPHRPL